MPCRSESSDEGFAQGPDKPNTVTPPRRLHNAEASQDKSYAQNSEYNDSDAPADDYCGDQLFSLNSEKRKRVLEILVWTTVKTWVTGVIAELEDADIKYQLALAAREIMNESGSVKLPRNKNKKTDLGIFKKNQSHTNHELIPHQACGLSVYLALSYLLPYGDTRGDGSRLY